RPARQTERAPTTKTPAPLCQATCRARSSSSALASPECPCPLPSPVPAASSSPCVLRSPLAPPYSLDLMAAPNRATPRPGLCDTACARRPCADAAEAPSFSSSTATPGLSASDRLRCQGFDPTHLGEGRIAGIASVDETVISREGVHARMTQTETEI